MAIQKLWIHPWGKKKKNSRYYNDASNQKYAKTFSFINLFNSSLHVSGDKFAHPQEHFLPYIELLVQCDNTAAAVSAHCTKSCIYSQKVLLRLGESVSRNM